MEFPFLPHGIVRKIENTRAHKRSETSEEDLILLTAHFSYYNAMLVFWGTLENAVEWE